MKSIDIYLCYTLPFYNLKYIIIFKVNWFYVIFILNDEINLHHVHSFTFFLFNFYLLIHHTSSYKFSVKIKLHLFQLAKILLVDIKIWIEKKSGLYIRKSTINSFRGRKTCIQNKRKFICQCDAYHTFRRLN